MKRVRNRIEQVPQQNRIPINFARQGLFRSVCVPAKLQDRILMVQRQRICAAYLQIKRTGADRLPDLRNRCKPMDIHGSGAAVKIVQHPDSPVD